jgi:hypothetical protein
MSSTRAGIFLRPDTLRRLRERWAALAHSTRRVDRPEAERRIKEAFLLAELQPPVRFLWFSSPMGCLLGIGALRSVAKGRAAEAADAARTRTSALILERTLHGLSDGLQKVSEDERTRVDQEVQNWVEERVYRRFRAAIRERIAVETAIAHEYPETRRRLLERLAPTAAEVRDRTGPDLPDAILGHALDFSKGLIHRRWGWTDDSWLAHYEAFVRAEPSAFDARMLRRFRSLVEVREAVGVFFAFDRTAICCDNPVGLETDGSGRLHSPDGPAVRYADGWSLWSWRGVRVDQDVIERPETVTVARIEREENVELRRVMVERIGWQRYVQESGLKPIDSDDWGSLYGKRMPGDPEPMMVVRVTNSTPEPDGSFKDYFLRVHPECRPVLPDGTLGDPQKPTPRNAIASTFGLTGEEYAKLLVQT